jgi:two-component system, NtrC family, sensor kinase
MGRGPKPTRGKAKPAGSRQSPKNEDSKVRDLEKRLVESLDRETATSEILRVISQSPTEVQPVFEAIVRSGAALCHAPDVIILIADNGSLRIAASVGPVAASVRQSPLFQGGGLPLTRGSVSGRAFIDRRTVHVHDVSTMPEEEFPEGKVLQREYGGHGTTLSVPLLRDNVSLGAITLLRNDVSPFTDRQVALLETFADQAVIAIENVRLFNETKEALEQQTATGDILKVIASSPTDIQPVFDAVAESAARLCESSDAEIFRRDGDRLLLVAHHGPIPSQNPEVPLVRETFNGRAVLDGRSYHVADLPSETKEFPRGSELARQHGTRAQLSVPLIREGVAIGTISLRRTEARLFTDRQVALLQTFADQAVIAIENVRLFTEVEARNKELTEALEQQTATGEILRAIAQAPTDTQPVFDAIARSASQLCHAAFAGVFVTDGRMIDLPANYGASLEALDAARRMYPRPMDMHTTAGVAILTKSVVHVPDTEESSVSQWVRDIARRIGFRSMVTVPMLRESAAVGAINVDRTEPGQFSDAEVALLQTFADQAVIAIENVRLFKELQTSNRDLTTALEQQTATGEILGVISSSPTDVQPVFDTIVRSARRLLGGRAVTVRRLVGDELVLAAYSTTTESGDELMRSRSRILLTEEPALWQVVNDRVPHIVSDTETDPTLGSKSLEQARARGFRSLLVVPLLRENNVIGILGVGRREPGPFTDDQVALLQTFADQAVIAIENVRLFKELEAANRELAAASQHKSEFLANMSHELRTPLNAIIGFSEVLSEKMFGELNEKQEEYSKDIHASGQHLLFLINDILDLSKIEAGRMELELSNFHLPTALDSALTLVRERAGRRSIALHLSVDERLGQIQGDERKVRQVVLNLLSNAIKFTPEGGRIDVKAMPKDGFVEVSVSDTGVGIAAEDQEAVFEEFRQVGTADKKVEGTGLGLTLCRKFVELHGGRIWVKSQVGAGSTFTFTIPVRCGE